MNRPFFQVGLDGVRLPSRARLKSLRRDYASFPVLKLPGFLSPGLCRHVVEQTARFRFIHEPLYERSSNFKEPEVMAARALSAVLSEPALCRAVGEVISCGVKEFEGVFSRHLTGARMLWHGDVSEGLHRVAGLSINVSAAPFEGGCFQFRREGSSQAKVTIPYGNPGNAVLFMIDPRWQHRGTPVLGAAPKTIFLGFFYADDAANLSRIYTPEKRGRRGFLRPG